MYISGSYFKSFCKFRLGEYIDARSPVPTFSISEFHNNIYVFCKTEFIYELSRYTLPDGFILLTHNSDINIFNDLAECVFDMFPSMGIWYAQNMMTRNPKVRPLPIGIANPRWEHGSIDRFRRVSSKNYSKKEIAYVNFNVQTNPEHRKYCLEQIGSGTDTVYPIRPNAEEHNIFTRDTQDKYLEEMAAAYFTVSPFGNGIDCHKTWEAIYMRSVPIVIKTPMSEAFNDIGIPMVMLNDWSEYKSLNLSKDMYNHIWRDFDPYSMDFNKFVSL